MTVNQDKFLVLTKDKKWSEHPREMLTIDRQQ